jgi:putative oxidoreductase
MIEVDIASVVLRLALAVTMVAHGWNHAFGGGGLAGTARWFDSIGIRPGRVHAFFATMTELGAGTLLAAGLLTPLCAGAVVGTMVVALVANHLKNGFFIFRPGEGYEYVLFITLASVALSALGGGRLSLDHAFGMDDALEGWAGLCTAVSLGVGGAALLLTSSWRPRRV